MATVRQLRGPIDSLATCRRSDEAQVNCRSDSGPRYPGTSFSLTGWGELSQETRSMRDGQVGSEPRQRKPTGYASPQWTLSCVDGVVSEACLSSPHASFVIRDPDATDISCLMLHRHLTLAAFPIIRTQTVRRTSRHTSFHAAVGTHGLRSHPWNRDPQFFLCK